MAADLGLVKGIAMRKVGIGRSSAWGAASDSATVRAVVASAEEEVKEIAPEDVLIVDNKQRLDQERVGVLLLNLGGPDTLEDVQPFLFNLFADPVILLFSFEDFSFGISLHFSYTWKN